MTVDLVRVSSHVNAVTVFDGMDLTTREWIPVMCDGLETRVSLRGLFVRGHEFTDLGESLEPAERDAMTRFLPSVAALILRHGGPDVEQDTLDEVRFDEDAVHAFFDEHVGRFDLRGDTPFMQVHGVTVEAVEAAVAADPTKAVLPITGLFNRIFEPDSKKVFQSGHDPRDVTDVGLIAVMLVMQWFHTKPNNTNPPFNIFSSSVTGSPHTESISGCCDKKGHKPVAGAASGAGSDDSSLYYVGRNVTETILLNTFTEWLDGDDLPAWFDQDYAPAVQDVHQIAEGAGLWATTFSPNALLLHWVDGQPVGVIGPGLRPQPVPLVAAELKDNGREIHRFDPYHLRVWIKDKTTQQDILVPVGSRIPSRFDAISGRGGWYADAVADALDHWANKHERAIEPDRRQHRLALYRESGSAQSPDLKVTEWTVAPITRVIVGDPDRRALLDTLFRTVNKHADLFYKHYYSALGRSSKDNRPKSITRHFYAAVDQVTATAVVTLTDLNDLATVLNTVTEASIKTLATVTNPHATPLTAKDIIRAQIKHRSDARKLTRKTLAANEGDTTNE